MHGSQNRPQPSIGKRSLTEFKGLGLSPPAPIPGSFGNGYASVSLLPSRKDISPESGAGGEVLRASRKSPELG